MRTSALITVLVIALLLTAGGCSSDTSADMFRGNPARTGVYPSGGPSDEPELLWKFKTGLGEGSSPAVSNGIVYVGGSDWYLYALDAGSGQEKWKFLTDYGVTSSPAVSDGAVYVGSWVYLYALDARDGREKWKFLAGDAIDATASSPVGPGYAPTKSSPAVSDGVVYFGSDSGFLYALDTASGQEKWRFQTGDNEYFSYDHSNHSSPAVSDGVVYVGSNEGFLYAVDAQSGQEKWRFQAGDEVRSSPAVSDGVVYFASIEYDPVSVPTLEELERRSGYLYALDAQSGQEKWRSRAEDVFSSPAVSNGVVYFSGHADNPQPVDSGSGGLWIGEMGIVVERPSALGDAPLAALDVATGEELWQFPKAHNFLPYGLGTDPSPSISGGVVYFVADDGRLCALDTTTGQKLWDWGSVRASSSSPTISGGVVYFMGRAGSLCALK